MSLKLLPSNPRDLPNYTTYKDQKKYRYADKVLDIFLNIYFALSEL